jgi:hypothetical protein
MAETQLHTPASDYLTRLASLAVGHTPPSAAHTTPVVVVLRPRLPSRFEATPESAGVDEAGSELETTESASPTAQREERQSRPVVAAMPIAVPASSQDPPAVRRLREPEPALEPQRPRAPERLEAPPGELQERFLVPQERLNQPAQNQPSPVVLSTRPVVSKSESTASQGSPAAVSPGRAARRISSPESIEATEGPRSSRIATPAEASRLEHAAAPTTRVRSTLRPVPPTPPEIHDEEQMTAGGASAGGRGEARATTAVAPERRAEPVPPIINVTIGRIEIRAPAAPPAAPAPRVEPPRPAVSLDDYLQRRADGRY